MGTEGALRTQLPIPESNRAVGGGGNDEQGTDADAGVLADPEYTHTEQGEIAQPGFGALLIPDHGAGRQGDAHQIAPAEALERQNRPDVGLVASPAPHSLENGLIVVLNLEGRNQ